jgi:hypothetical protein
MPRRKPARRKPVASDPPADAGIDSAAALGFDPPLAEWIATSLKGVSIPIETRGMNRRARNGKRPDLLYNAEPDGDAFWDWILKGDPSRLLRPLPGKFPPDVSMPEYMRDLESLVSRLVERRQEVAKSLLFYRVNVELEPTRRDRAGSYSEREAADALDVSKGIVHSMADKVRMLAAMHQHLERTRPDRMKSDQKRARVTRRSHRTR